MKKVTVIVSLLLACACAWAQGIGSAKDLQEFIAAYNNGESLSQWSEGDSIVVLTADIDLGKVKKLEQITSFSGRFDGRGFRLKNWKTASAGLFKVIGEGADVSNIIIDKSCQMKLSTKGEELHVGFIADENRGTIRGCINEGGITHKCGYATAPVFIGGIAGSNRYVIRDCRNEGKLASDVSSGLFTEEIFLSIGGITGGAASKPARGSVIVGCDNSGEVSGAGNLACIFVGGISGSSARTNIKYCVNHGVVKSTLSEAEEGGKFGLIRVGGIAGMAKGDVLRCDNFGSVSSTGACGSGIAGIVGVPHNTLVMADCVNYGEVKASGEQPSHAGGIAGAISRPVHIRGCVNYGKIVFDGISSRARSTAGGIVGSIVTPKSQTESAYVSRCMNHGEVYAGNGGNKYDASNRNSIHAGGVIGCAEIRPGLRARIADNFNDGKVSCDGGRKGSIAGGAYGVNVTGKALDDWATLLDKPASDGSNVSGYVKTTEGKPLEGILVTDGIQFVKTGKDGSYKMTSDLSSAHFIYLSIPSNMSAPIRDGVPQFSRRVPRYAKAVEASFVLEPVKPSADYTIMWIADPQVKPFDFPNDNSMDVWHKSVAPDAEAFRATCTNPVYCINLGDLVYNEMWAWDDYLAGAAKIACPTFNVIGNHDYDQQNLFDTNLGNIFYETYVGPEHYSFDLGDIHYIVLNTILYDRKDSNDQYHYGLEERTLQWLKADLENVPKDRIVMTCSHHNLFKTPASSPNGSHGVYNLNYKRYLDLFKDYKAVYSWNGHQHINFYYNYANHFGKDTKHGSPNIQCIAVARTTGALRYNSPLGSAGEPRGYIVMNVHGENVDWYYKGVGTGQETQMRGYAPAVTGDGTVKVTIWNWSEGWGTPEWYENGEKVADMEFTPGVDYAYKELYDAYDNQTNRKYCIPHEACMMFSVTPSSGVTSGEIRVTDMFGNTYTQTVSWQ